MYLPTLLIGGMLPPLVMLLTLAGLRKHFRCFVSANRAGAAATAATAAAVVPTSSDDNEVVPSFSRAVVSPDGILRLVPRRRRMNGGEGGGGLLIHRGRMDVASALKEICLEHPDAVEVQVLVGGEGEDERDTSS